MSGKAKETNSKRVGLGTYRAPTLQDSPTLKVSKARIQKNLVVVSFGFLCLLTAFESLSNLQSSINKDASLGTNGLATIYAALVVSCMFLPPVIIARLGCKWTIALSMLCYILYMCANFYVRYYTIIPSAIILGLGAAPLWSAKCTYITETGVWYSKLTGTTEDDVINRFFGFFFMVFQISQIIGNLVSSLVFKHQAENRTTDDNLLTCGANFCPDSHANNSNLDSPADEKIYTVFGIYLGCALLAFLVIAIGLDPITLDREEEKVKGGRKFSLHLVLETQKHLWRSNYQKLLIPLSMYNGIQAAFMTGDYTKSYVACVMGIEKIGFVLICFGVVNAICCGVFGRLVQFVGNAPFFGLAFLLHGGLLITFLLWEPTPDGVYMIYLFAGLWGSGHAILKSQLNAVYGYLWTKDSEAAFTNYRLWESLGYIIAFATQGYICTNVKLYIAMGFLCVGMLGYATVEIVYRNNKSTDSERSWSLLWK